ncbi:PREDICTED: F-box only protein 2-like isoform X1 [Acromyrmex echinatior]|uniref:F-box only protein 2-like isoform X1 n=1 Tax=Acromyrmex echinatior TaxID=103372 RepID=UPI000580EB44|nr:PREDICTED: F-box only protein 2-like isoform X1 [Acromyrmex echinatior]
MRQCNDILSHTMFDEKDCNGLVLCDKFLPVEILTDIFFYVDYKTAMNCRLVCKRWQVLMNHVWYKKTNQTMAKPFPWDNNMPWSVFYLTCTKKPYGRNLLKDYSDTKDMDYWRSLNWRFRCNSYFWLERPMYVPNLKDIIYHPRIQNVDLEDEGIHPYIIDTYRPTIEISEWINCREDHPPISYELTVELVDINNKQVEQFYTSYDIKREEQNQRLQFLHTFEDYGIGVRKITFKHGEMNGLKMLRTCVSVKIPEKAFVLSQS